MALGTTTATTYIDMTYRNIGVGTTYSDFAPFATHPGDARIFWFMARLLAMIEIPR